MDELGTDTSNEAGETARAAYRDGLIKVLDYLDTRLNDCRVVGKKRLPISQQQKYWVYNASDPRRNGRLTALFAVPTNGFWCSTELVEYDRSIDFLWRTERSGAAVQRCGNRAWSTCKGDMSN